MDTPPTVAQCEKAADEARIALNSVEAMVREEKRKAERAVEEKHREVVTAARRAVSDAERALREAKDREPEHPWTGKRVFKMEETRRHGWEPSKLVRVEGVVETRRTDTDFPINTAGYRLPNLGDGFVRLLTKDGKPGKKFEELSNRMGRSLWSLVEDAECPPA